MIARTETSRAVNEGSLQGYEQVGLKNVERIEAADCCEVCAPESGTVYTIDAARGVLPAHPDCRGCWGATTRPASRRAARKPKPLKEIPRRMHLPQDMTSTRINNRLASDAKAQGLLLTPDDADPIQSAVRNYSGRGYMDIRMSQKGEIPGYWSISHEKLIKEQAKLVEDYIKYSAKYGE